LLFFETEQRGWGQRAIGEFVDLLLELMDSLVEMSEANLLKKPNAADRQWNTAQIFWRRSPFASLDRRRYSID
jgi:hypothetical protein